MKSISTKGALQGLLSISNQLDRISSSQPQHEKLINFLVNHPKNKEFPSLKEISQHINCTVHSLQKQAKNLYFLIIEREFFFHFDDIQYRMHFYFEEKKQIVRLKFLSSIPQIGTAINFPLLTPIFGFSLFYVSRIQHSFEGKNQLIDIFLTADKPGEDPPGQQDIQQPVIQVKIPEGSETNPNGK